jgi:hypothetical protein
MPNLTIKTRPRHLASCTHQIEHHCTGRRIHRKWPKMPYSSLIMNNRKYLTLIVFATILALTPSGNLHANRKSSDIIPPRTPLKGWKTNTAKRTIELNELISGPGQYRANRKEKTATRLSTETTSHLHGLFSRPIQKSTPDNTGPVGR